MQKHWKTKPEITEMMKHQFPDVNHFTLQLLVNRGMNTQEAFDEFLRSDWSHDIHDPFLMPDMKQAVGRVFKAIEADEHIVIFGDYDADGTCSSAILHGTLKRLGATQVSTYIPHREREGYGLNTAALEQLKEQGVSLVITVDLGISNVEEIAWAQEHGVDVIVVDHHEFRVIDGEVVLPEAYAIIHTETPNNPYPCKHLSGGGTAFKLAQALLDHSLEDHEAFEKWLLDLVAISTVADVVPLVEENRTLVKYGLMVLNKTQRPGLRKLIEVAKINGRGSGTISVHNHFNLDAWNIAFQIAPRINAAGRIAHADDALALLLAESEIEAESLAIQLNTINTERQKLANDMYKEAVEQIGEVTDETYLLAAHSPTWTLGIVGLVAGRLSGEFYRPVVLLTDAEGFVTGSGRSIEGYDMKQGLDAVVEHLERAGGHAMACGMKMKPENKDAFIEAFSDVTKAALQDRTLKPTITVDMTLPFKDVTWELVESVDEFAPFGEANPMPLFMSTRLVIKRIQFMGGNKQHLKLSLTDEFGEVERPAIGFFMADEWKERLSLGEKVDMVYEVGVNEWNGNREIQIKIKDLRLTNG